MPQHVICTGTELRHMRSCITLVYVGYYFVMLAAIITELNTPGNLWSPALLIIVTGLHFLYGLKKAWDDRNATATLTDRYMQGTCSSFLAIATDALLVGAFVAAVVWMDAAVRSHQTPADNLTIDELFVATLIMAAVGNFGCILLHIGSLDEH